MPAHQRTHVCPSRASQAQWAAALGAPALPFVLQLLGSLARTHAGTQALLLAPEVMSRIHALERQSSSAAKVLFRVCAGAKLLFRLRCAEKLFRSDSSSPLFPCYFG